MTALRPGADGIEPSTQPRGDVVRLGFVFGLSPCVPRMMIRMAE